MNHSYPLKSREPNDIFEGLWTTRATPTASPRSGACWATPGSVSLPSRTSRYWKQKHLWKRVLFEKSLWLFFWNTWLSFLKHKVIFFERTYNQSFLIKGFSFNSFVNISAGRWTILQLSGKTTMILIFMARITIEHIITMPENMALRDHGAIVTLVRKKDVNEDLKEKRGLL